MDNDTKQEFGEIAQNIAPYGIMMAVFTLFYSVWFCFAWGNLGRILFALTVAYGVCIVFLSIKNIKHAKRFKAVPSKEGKKIAKSMTIVSAITYPAMTVCVVMLVAFHLEKLILPAVTFVIGLHFIPLGKIMNRKIDYFIAPVPIVFSLVASYLAFTTAISWVEVYAVAGIGGACATMIYGAYMLYAYKKVAQKYGVEYP
ncbi:hypothetical protein [Treponema sp. Marseille-Q3903]|uniref:hypothetical protein n=1 Tax=Treponema sp. Marseille-Q3903 TaxID=2766703 RepID=UPI0016520531|nr:hypothetical protein [Treponema sp. Marseille-Q3903]MBC6713264.1 hypothetical protein [Treponema sp. Marseille-Q3903]